ncbi:MAG TPA: hypothetical protein VFK79_05830 [Xanthobacteraceae bacterium]|nr:hypothetical protein [Xanthobacteraceae bacterium]
MATLGNAKAGNGATNSKTASIIDFIAILDFIAPVEGYITLSLHPFICLLAGLRRDNPGREDGREQP